MSEVAMLKGRVILADGREHEFQVTAENWVQWGTVDADAKSAAVDALTAAQYALAFPDDDPYCE